MSADSAYRLYVNGHFVGRGPVRSYPEHKYYDIYDLAPHLRPGKNVIAALVHFYGEDTAWHVAARAGVIGYTPGSPPEAQVDVSSPDGSRASRSIPNAVPGKGGFLFQCDLRNEAGEEIFVTSDETWRLQRASAWRQDTPRANFSLGFVEVYDARNEPRGWKDLDFDDSGWKRASPYWSWTKPVPPTEPFTRMIPRDIPFLLEELVSAVQIVEMGQVTDQQRDIPGDQMVLEEISPFSDARIKNPQDLLASDGRSSQVRAPAGKSVSVVFDFGRTVTGYSRLQVDGPSGVIIDIGVSERLWRDREKFGISTGAQPFPDKKTGVLFNMSHGKQADRYITRAGKQVWETGDVRGFRYMQVTFRNIVEPLLIDAISVNFTSYPVGQRGSFSSSSERLDRIWYTGAYTLQVNMTDGYLDCPSREQRQWVGDAHVEAMINYAAFGDPRLTAKFLRQTAQSQQSDGMTMPYAPGDHGVLRIILVDFCLQWINAIYDYYMYTGDAELVRELYPNVRRGIGWFERQVGPDGLLGRLPHWTFIDWADVEKRGAVTALNALFYKSLQAAAAMADLSQMPDRKRFEDLAARVKDGINQKMWDARRGVYVDCYEVGRPCQRVSQHSNALAVLFDIAPEDRWHEIVRYVTDPERVRLRQTDMRGLVTPGPFNEETDVVLAQPFFSYFLHRAMAKAGAFDRVLARIDRMWGGMLDEGATTWWEEWQRRTNSSESHAWSGSPTFDLSTDVLGVRPTEPGFARFLVEPKPSGLTSAEGTFPTVKGDIYVKWKSSSRGFTMSVASPEDTKMDVALPVEQSARIQVNGAVVWDGSRFHENSVGVSNVRAERRQQRSSVRLAVERGGEYRFEAR